MQFTLAEETILANKEEFINLIESVEREGFDKERLIDYLEASDFFYAPASTKYHGSYKGGLVDHCLCVYHNLAALVKSKGLEDIISNNSIILSALCHDFAKINLYETCFANKKVYSENGKKFDEGGKFDWVAEKSYKTVDMESRFVYGNHEETSEYIARKYVPLLEEESIAILNHHAGMGFDSTKADVSPIYERYPLAVLLHMADMVSCYIDQA